MFLNKIVWLADILTQVSSHVAMETTSHDGGGTCKILPPLQFVWLPVPLPPILLSPHFYFGTSDRVFVM